jgi:hypothetical protein
MYKTSGIGCPLFKGTSVAGGVAFILYVKKLCIRSFLHFKLSVALGRFVKRVDLLFS